MNAADARQMIRSEKGIELFSKLYGKDSLEFQTERYDHVIDGFTETYPRDEDFLLFSSPGRTEISGNHTDHNHGKVIGGSINLDCIAAAAVNDSNCIHILSETFQQKFTVDLNEIEPGPKHAGTAELLKGILKGFRENGYRTGGFDAYITSNVISSAGVSSSAAFETLICQILNTMFNSGTMEKTEYAQIGKYAENKYWNKGSGLLDQMCCAVGGLITIDFKNPAEPSVKKINFDFAGAAHSLIIVQTGKGHADLTEDYSSIPDEMRSVAGFFKKEFLADISEQDVLDHLNEIRQVTGDRAVMRSFHFFEENRRVDAEVEALEKGDFNTFLKNITESGNSSWKYLQNCYTTREPEEQGISIFLALTELFLARKQCGACRVHGGGFAGVIMALIPNELVDEYIFYMDRYTGKGNAYRMFIRPLGSICINGEIC